MSARRRYANRINARRSTGPRTRAGKARAVRNARQHGLSVYTLGDPAVAAEVGALARAIAGTHADAQLIALAWSIAGAQVALRRASTARHEILSDPCRDPAAAFAAIAAIERYEARARRCRKLAMAAFEAACVDSTLAPESPREDDFYQTKPTSENVDQAKAYM
jgi:hypothetical protein